MISTKNSNIPDEEIFECLKRERIGIEFITDFNLEYDPKPPVTSRSSELIVNKTSNLYCVASFVFPLLVCGFLPPAFPQLHSARERQRTPTMKEKRFLIILPPYMFINESTNTIHQKREKRVNIFVIFEK
jgi:hypothetical protein